MEDIGVGIGEICVTEYMIMTILILKVEGCTMNHLNTNEVYRHIQHFKAIQHCSLFFGSTEIASGKSITRV